MASTASPYGMIPIQRLASDYNNSALSEFYCVTNNSNVIAKGDPVMLVNGSIQAVTATPVAGTVGNTTTPIGVLMGVSYQDPVLGFVNREYMPAGLYNTLNAAGAPYSTSIRVKVADNNNLVFKIQGNAQISATLATALQAVGKTAAITGFGGATSTNDYQSQVVLNVSTISTTSTTSTYAVRIIGFASNPGSQPTDAAPDLLVKWNANVHAYEQAGSQ